MPNTDPRTAARQEDLAAVVGAAAPIIAVVLGSLPPGTCRPGMVAFTYHLNGITVTVGDSCTPAFRTSLLTEIAHAFGKARWGYTHRQDDATNELISTRLSHPGTLIRADSPTI